MKVRHPRPTPFAGVLLLTLAPALLVGCGVDAPASPWTDQSRSAGFGVAVADAGADIGFDARDTGLFEDAAAHVDAMAFAVERAAPMQIGTSSAFRMATLPPDAPGTVASSPRFTLYVAPGG